MYSETTRSINVTVKPFYLEDQSSPVENHYVWAYHVRIENERALVDGCTLLANIAKSFQVIAILIILNFGVATKSQLPSAITGT